MSTAEPHHAKRQLTLIDCLGIGINGIVGSGIFFLPAALWRTSGGRGPIAWLIVGSLCCLVALCFAEAASRTDRSGGPYRYACDAFGPYVGFGIGWVTLLSTILGYAAVARGFGITAAGFIGLSGQPAVEILLSCLMVSGLCAINILGVRSSARTGDVISAIKILSLVLFILVGMFFVKLANLNVPPQPAAGEQVGLLAAAFAGLFACTGFEYIPVPAGEAQNPRRTVPLAMVISVLASTALYALVQLVATGVHPTLGGSETPLVDAVGQFSGQRGRKVMELAALISSFGFCASSALVGPRYLEAFAEDGFMPKLFMQRVARWGTPAMAVMMLSALVVGLLVSGLKFQRLADVSNVAVVVQYVATCIAVLVLRRKPVSGKQLFVIPFGPLVPCLALAGCIAFLQFVGPFELKLAAVMITIGLAIGAINRSSQRRKAQHSGGADSPGGA